MCGHSKLENREISSDCHRAQPPKRTWIHKPDGRQRPLGIAAVEDKILQMATVWVLNANYEQDFVNFSYLIDSILGDWLARGGERT